MLNDEELRSLYDLGMRDDEHPLTGDLKGLRAVEDAVRADQIEKTIDAAWSIAQSQYNEGHTESAFGANLVREHFAAIRAQLNEGTDHE